MRERLGDVCNFIDNEQFLGVFRNRQINYEKEFNQSVKMVKLMKKQVKLRMLAIILLKFGKKKTLLKH